MKVYQNDKTVSISLVSLASVLYATYGIWTKLLGSDFDAFSQAWLRATFIACCMIGIAWRTNRLSRINFKDSETRKWLLMLLIANAFIQGPMYYSINKAGIGLSMTVGYGTAVLAAYTLGWAINHELMTRENLFH
jgi:drug/metabolite transporter (DMT)-like permease